MINYVDRKNDKNSVFLYTLSTYVWCKKNKASFSRHGN